MKNINWKSAILTGNLLILLLLAVSLFFINNLNQSIKEIKPSSMSNADIEGQRLYSVMLLYAGIENDYLPVYNTKIDEHLIINKIENEPILIIRYSLFSCQNCVGFVKQTIENVKKNYAEDPRILFVASDYKSKNRELKNTIFLDTGESLGFSAEEISNTPIIFIYHENTVKHLFIADANNRELIDVYLKSVFRRYNLAS